MLTSDRRETAWALRYLACLFVLAGQTRLWSQESNAVDLLAGRDLSRWVVTDCAAEIVDDSLLLKDGNGFVRTPHAYQDFVLELDFRAHSKDDWDSGVYVRADVPPPGKPWPDRHQVNLKRGYEGNLLGYPKAVSKGLTRDGEWNAMRIEAEGPKVSVAINGQKAWEIDDFEVRPGVIGFQAEVPGGGQFSFRNVHLVEKGYVPLFDGKSLEGWEGAGEDAAKCWSVEDGLLVCSGQPGPWLRSQAEFGDFNLRLEYQLREAGNSGVYVRVPADGNHHGDESGIEVQVLDDHSEKYRELKDYQYTGSLYAITAANPRVCRRPGEWNALEIECRGDAYRVVHNGVVVVATDGAANPELAKRRLAGFLGLQNHSERVAFRNVRVRKL